MFCTEECCYAVITAYIVFDVVTLYRERFCSACFGNYRCDVAAVERALRVGLFKGINVVEADIGHLLGYGPRGHCRGDEQQVPILVVNGAVRAVEYGVALFNDHLFKVGGVLDHVEDGGVCHFGGDGELLHACRDEVNLRFVAVIQHAVFEYEAGVAVRNADICNRAACKGGGGDGFKRCGKRYRSKLRAVECVVAYRSITFGKGKRFYGRTAERVVAYRAACARRKCNGSQAGAVCKRVVAYNGVSGQRYAFKRGKPVEQVACKSEGNRSAVSKRYARYVGAYEQFAVERRDVRGDYVFCESHGDEYGVPVCVVDHAAVGIERFALLGYVCNGEPRALVEQFKLVFAERGLVCGKSEVRHAFGDENKFSFGRVERAFICLERRVACLYGYRFKRRAVVEHGYKVGRGKSCGYFESPRRGQEVHYRLVSIIQRSARFVNNERGVSGSKRQSFDISRIIERVACNGRQRFGQGNRPQRRAVRECAHLKFGYRSLYARYRELCAVTERVRTYACYCLRYNDFNKLGACKGIVAYRGHGSGEAERLQAGAGEGIGAYFNAFAAVFERNRGQRGKPFEEASVRRGRAAVRVASLDRGEVCGQPYRFKRDAAQERVAGQVFKFAIVRKSYKLQIMRVAEQQVARCLQSRRQAYGFKHGRRVRGIGSVFAAVGEYFVAERGKALVQRNIAERGGVCERPVAYRAHLIGKHYRGYHAAFECGSTYRIEVACIAAEVHGRNGRIVECPFAYRAEACGKVDPLKRGSSLERPGIYYEQLASAAGKRHRFKAAAAHECAFSYNFKGGGKAYAFKVSVAGECIFADLRNAFGNSVICRRARRQVIEQLLHVCRVYRAAFFVGGKVNAAFDVYLLQVLAAEHARAERLEVRRKFDEGELVACIEYRIPERGHAVGQFYACKLVALAECVIADFKQLVALESYGIDIAVVNGFVRYPYGIGVHFKFARLACGAI